MHNRVDCPISSRILMCWTEFACGFEGPREIPSRTKLVIFVERGAAKWPFVVQPGQEPDLGWRARFGRAGTETFRAGNIRGKRNRRNSSPPRGVGIGDCSANGAAKDRKSPAPGGPIFVATFHRMGNPADRRRAGLALDDFDLSSLAEFREAEFLVFRFADRVFEVRLRFFGNGAG